MSKFLSKEAGRLDPYTPGEQPQDQQYIKLNTNESPFPPSPKVLEALSGAEIARLNLYSDPTCASLTAAIAGRCHVQPENVIAGNGSDEIRAFSFRAFCGEGKPLAYADITYGFYRSQVALFGLESKVIPLREDFTLCVDDYMDFPGTIVIANPNAPTGMAVPRSDIRRLLEADPNRVVIVDEAGGRVGFAIGSPALIAALNRVKYSFNPYNVNRLSMVAGTAAMEDEDYFRACTAAVCSSRAWTVQELEKLGFTVLPSQTNFIFAGTDAIPGGELYRRLKESGILVRWFDADRIRNFVRITIGSQAQMTALVNAIAGLLQNR